MGGAGVAYGEEAAPPVEEQATVPVQEEAPGPAQEQTPAPVEKEIALSLHDVVRKALEANLDIAVERYNPDIRDAELLSAQGEFDPTITIDYSYSEEEVPQTTREGLASGAGTTDTLTKDLSLTLGGKLMSGTEYEAFFDREQSQFTQKDTFIDPDPLVLGDEFIGDVRNPSEYNLDLTFSLTQPLLKDFGYDANLADIRIARTQKGMSIEDFRKRVMDVIAEAQSAYWDLVATIENLRVTERSLEVAQDLLEENRIRLEVGTMAQLEVLQAETGVAQREEEVIVSRALIKDAEDNLKRILNLPKDTEEWKTRIVPTDQPVIVETEADLLSLLEAALEKRPDYKRSLMQIETDAINERFARNQLLPSVDLTGEYQFRAVNSELHSAFDDIERGTSPSWLLGVTAEYPIGNRTAKGDYSKARLEKMQSVKEAENLRLAIIVDVKRAVRGIETSLKLIEATRKGAELARESLSAERKKLEVGVTTSHDVLEFESELTDAERREIVANIGYRKALINLAVAVGTILEENNIVIEEAL
jgi:outer membrane protein TolC